ncbi:unnamed protein product [Symbiodinium natans]|uniref:Uncharacterized protein n=1 Tax=Symbiodinium natans TaxID=878477 RepID=A0A812UJL8_9DINO|nr:unnamed protein product [Symbiodinium natans]
MPKAMKKGVASKKMEKKVLLKEAAAKKNLRCAAKTTMAEGEEATLEEMIQWLRAHPAQCSSMLASVKKGVWDGSSSDDEDEDRLAPYMNKIRLISKPKLLDILSDLLPQAHQWLKVLPRKTKKEELAAILAFLVHMSPTSALPTKILSRLLEEFKERWADFGKRAKDWRPISDKQEFWDHHAYWSIDINSDATEGFLCYGAGVDPTDKKNRVALPSEIVSHATTVENAASFDGAIIKKGALMRNVVHLLSELGEANRWVRPLFLKEVPGGDGQLGKTKKAPPAEASKIHKRRDADGDALFTPPRRVRQKGSSASSPLSSKASSHASPSPRKIKKRFESPSISKSRGKPSKMPTPPKGKGGVLDVDGSSPSKPAKTGSSPAKSKPKTGSSPLKEAANNKQPGCVTVD